MRYSISQVARFSGVTARTLRHYEEIGLLAPAELSANGYRWYGRAELLRLQRILVLRRLGLKLEKIAEVLAERADEAVALQEHLVELEAERARIDRIIATVRQTVADLDHAQIDDPAAFFIGFKQDREAMRTRFRKTYGEAVDATFEAVEAAQASYTTADHEHEIAQGMALFRRLADVMRSGAAPDDPAALDAVAEHYASLVPYWQPSPEAYAAMGAMYLTDPTQRAIAEKADADLPAWLGVAIQAYVQTRLTPSRTPQ